MADLKMIDFFALALSHGLLALAAVRILLRRDLDVEDGAPEPAPPESEAKTLPGLRTRA
jgi:hypothetical protein